MSGQLFFVDGYALIYRAHFAFIKNPLVNSRGEVTSAVYGLALSLQRILDECSPDYLSVVLDTSKPSFRHEKFPEYKATREKMPGELKEQLPWARELIECLRIPILEMEGYEADDVIGTLATLARKQGLDAVIVSGDKDFYQLVGEQVKIFNPRKGGLESEWIDRSKTPERLGVFPEQVVDLLSLMGDAADNVPGVRGVGQKTAVKLLDEFKSLDQIYRNLDRVNPESLRKKLAEGQESAMLSRYLVTIKTDLPVTLDLKAMRVEKPDMEKLGALFKRLEFRSLIERYGLAEEKTRKTPKDYRLVDSLDMLDRLVDELRRTEKFAVDVETTSLDPMLADLVGLSLAWSPHRAFYIPLAHETGPNLPLDQVLARLRPLLENEHPGCVGQNIKYDMIVLARHGAKVRGVTDDPMVASYLLDPGRRSHGLDFLALDLLNHKTITYEEVTGSGKQQVTFDKVPVNRACEYSAEDADIALLLAGALEERLAGEGDLLRLYRQVELPLIPVLAGMEMAGVAVDTAYFEKLSVQMQEKLDRLESQAYRLAGHEFNVNSTQQLAQVLFEEQGIPPVKKTKTGYSTDSSVLEALSAGHELPRIILEQRELAKLKSTYVDALPRQVNPRTGRIHTSFNQVVTATGRLSSSNPNLQNIPVRTEEGRRIRMGFVPQGPGMVLLSADYSQIELRLLAHLSGDESMSDDFRSGVDIHGQTASRLFGLPPHQVDPELRNRAKTINFGVLYGMGPHRLSRELGIPFREAKAFIDEYFRRYPRIREYIEQTVEQARRQGWVSTILGRRRKLPEILSQNRQVRENSERIALNTPIQGSAADLIKVAMIRVAAARLEREFPEAKMILQVHDELVFEVRESQAEKVGRLVAGLMESAIELKVPVKVDLGVGHNWLECK